ncbi:MAG TPA: hypothetical protein VLJ17_24810 [Xanthobacteraceae bacterium]|nr:hypothetical protein [Xanthobacteraceae bacterium]
MSIFGTRNFKAALALLGALICVAPAIAQLSTTHAGLGAPGGFSPSCSASTTFLARTSGMNNTEKSAYDGLICGLITDGNGCSAWSGSTGNFDLLYIFATNSTTTAALNLCSTSFGLTTNGSPTFTADVGYTGDGSAASLDTGWVPSTNAVNFTQNSASGGVCVLSTRTTSQNWSEYGTEGSSFSNTFGFQPNFTNGNQSRFWLNANSAPASPTSGSSVQAHWIITRTSSSAGVLYKNGVSDGTSSQTSSGLSATSMVILAGRNNGTIALFTNDQIAWVFLGGTLNATQASNINTRFHTFATAMSLAAC